MGFNLNIDKAKSRDTGMAITFLLILLELWLGGEAYLTGAAITLLLTMTIPLIFKPAAYIWFGIAHLVGAVMSSVVLTLVYLVFVTPVGIFRRILGKDPLQLNEWKKGTGSVFHLKEHQYEREDIVKPY